jgi:putative YphP/YqiW family bacilliredoxin
MGEWAYYFLGDVFGKGHPMWKTLLRLPRDGIGHTLKNFVLLCAMYPAYIVEPIRQETAEIGLRELRTPQEVEDVIAELKATGESALFLINSVCGCSAASARPAIARALRHATRPKRLYSVFAGVDKEATETLRRYLAPHPPSSPSIALWAGGKLVHFIPRHEIEGRSPEVIALALTALFDEYCTA